MAGHQSIYSISLACAVLCAAPFRNAMDALIAFATEAINWALSVLPVEAPAFAFAGEMVPCEGIGGFADPRVVRHEAGQSRRAAARGI